MTAVKRITDTKIYKVESLGLGCESLYKNGMWRKMAWSFCQWTNTRWLTKHVRHKSGRSFKSGNGKAIHCAEKVSIPAMIDPTRWFLGTTQACLQLSLISHQLQRVSTWISGSPSTTQHNLLQGQHLQRLNTLRGSEEPPQSLLQVMDYIEQEGPGVIISQNGVMIFVRHGATYVCIHHCRFER